MPTLNRHLRSYQALPDALVNVASLTEILKHFELMVFLDYDGTLVPIIPHPEYAFIDEQMRQTISALSQVASVGIVSGRNKSNIQDLLKLPNICYIGNHGFDIEGPPGSGIQREVGRECLHDMEKCFRELQARFINVSGIQFEPKKLTVTIHYQLVEPKHLSWMLAVMREIIGRYSQLKLTFGKQVWEIRPNNLWDKGRAVLWLAEQLHWNQYDYYILYIGDDLSDEDAFYILPPQGLGILVGNHEQETYADYHLQGPAQVKIFLDDLVKAKTDQNKRFARGAKPLT